MMNTKSDIPDGGRTDITAKVKHKTRPKISKRAWELQLEDINGSSFQLILWETHSVDGSKFSVGGWYEITEARGKYGDTLHSTADIKFERVPPPNTGPTKILHISDTHIGYGLRSRSDQYNQSIVKWIEEVDCLMRFRKAMKIAVRREVDAVLHTGDIFDDVVNNKHLYSFGKILSETIGEADIPFYYILGNHDPKNGKKKLKEAESAGLAKHLPRKVPTKVGSDVFLYGIDYRKRGWWNNPSLKFDDSLPKESYKVLCLHQSITPICPDRGTSEEIEVGTVLGNSNLEFDLLALGHEHFFYEQKNLSGYNCRAFYPGPTGRINKKYAKREPFVNLYTFSEGIERERIPVN